MNTKLDIKIQFKRNVDIFIPNKHDKKTVVYKLFCYYQQANLAVK